MRSRFWIVAAAGLAVLAGCNAEYEHALALQNAQASLESDFPEMAEQYLDKAERIADKHELDDEHAAEILRAEACLQRRKHDEAEAIAAGVADVCVPGTVARAQAEEILAKVAIRQGRFVDAQLHLAEAERSYIQPHDKQRAADLTALVRGLQAYSQGDTQVARAHWDSIVDEGLRASALAPTVE